MLLVVEVLPLTLYLIVGLQFHIGLAPLEAILLIPRDEVVEQQGVGTFLLLLGQDTNQHHIDTLGLMEFQRTKAVPPTKRPQASSVALLQSTGHRGD